MDMTDSNRLRDGSTVVRTGRSIWTKLRRAGASSFLFEGLRRADTSLSVAVRKSRVSTLVSLIGTWAQSSRFVRWLSREPTPRPVTIDVGESRVGSAVLTAFGYVQRPLMTARSTSRVRTYSHSIGAAPLQTLGAALIVLSTTNLVLLGVIGELTSFALFSRLSILMLGTLLATDHLSSSG